MPIKAAKKDIPDNSTQRYLPFSQIRENIIILKDNSARLVLKCSTINFLLKSTEEQDSIIISFQRFLNAIDFPIQIMVKSSKLDINGYISNLHEKALHQKNTLLQNQTYEYIEYLKKLVEVAQIMKKDFYIVIPYDELENKSVKDDSLLGPFKAFWASVFGQGIETVKIKEQIRKFDGMKKGLVNRSHGIVTSLSNMGIRATPLDKEELIKFLTDYYNPSLDSFVELKDDLDKYDISNNNN